MRTVILALAICVAACASAPREADRESILVFYSASMKYEIEDGGAARLISSSTDHGGYEFQASHEDFRRIAAELEPLKAGGLPCSAPSEFSEPGYIAWRRGEEEVRRVEMHTLCYADGSRPLARHTDRAWRLMEEMGHARYVAPAIPEPTIITLQNMYWGRPTSSWTIPRSGEGRYVDPQRTVTFEVSDETFNRVRETLRPYEARDFHCNRVLTDGPYGFVIWSSSEGTEDQRTLWDAGCVTGDAGDLFARIDAVMEILVPLRDAAQP
jgi:hypothetical protein